MYYFLRYPLGYGCEVLVNDIVEKAEMKDAPPNGLGLPYVSLDEIFTQSDVICLCAPLTRDTKQRLDIDFLHLDSFIII